MKIPKRQSRKKLSKEKHKRKTTKIVQNKMVLRFNLNNKIPKACHSSKMHIKFKELVVGVGEKWGKSNEIFIK